jgi:vacuolar-type H+-ATPase subunit H
MLCGRVMDERRTELARPAPEPGTVDFMYLLDRLEETLVTGSRVPLTARTLVDEQECLDILDQMRVALPGEVKYARRMVEERDTLLNQAREEAERIVRNAEAKAVRLVEEHIVVRDAQARALQIEDEAERSAEQIRGEAELYAGKVLSRVGERLEHALGSVRAGIRELETGDIDPR